MKLLLCIFLVSFLVTTSLGVDRPSDRIQTGPYHSVVQLTGTTIESSYSVDAMNIPLGMFKNWEVPNIGHYVSWNIEVSQENSTGIPTSLTNFSQQQPSNLTHVGNLLANFTVLNENSTEGLVFV